MKNKKCKHIKEDGKQCKAYAQKGSLFCYTHDPDKSRERALAVKSGGIITSQRPVRVTKVRDVRRFVTRTMNEVRKGEIDVKVANALFYGSNVLIKAFEISEIEDRLGSVEKLVMERRSYK